MTHVADVVEKGTERRGGSNWITMLKDRCIELNGSYEGKGKQAIGKMTEEDNVELIKVEAEKECFGNFQKTSVITLESSRKMSFPKLCMLWKMPFRNWNV